MPTIFNRMMYETWEKLGSKDCFDLAREKVKAILEGPVNAPSEAVAAKIKNLL
jgi:trimethylamine:corrinoid methyltransferase-like protein